MKMKDTGCWILAVSVPCREVTIDTQMDISYTYPIRKHIPIKVYDQGGKHYA
jgi:hypothetical protein